VFVLLFALAGAAVPDAADLLRRVAEQYRSAEGYTVEARVDLDSGMTVGGYFPQTRAERLAAAAGGRYSFAGRYIRIVSDGQNVWTYRPELKQYKVEPAAAAAATRLEDIGQMLMKRFATLDRIEVDARIRGERNVKTQSGIRRAWVVDLRPRPAESRTWTEELWIDAERSVVLTSIFRNAAPQRTGQVRTTTFDRVELVPPSDSEFVWTAPKGAKQVDRFSEPRLPSGPNPAPMNVPGR
jgi:outer membrane lipoprotein-sorting protein